MSFSDETLLAYADGQLDERTRRQIDLAMRRDPSLAVKIRRLQSRRANVFDAFAATLHDEVPQRAQSAARAGKVIQLDSVRPARIAPPAPIVEKPDWTWREWSALLVALAVGLTAGAAGAYLLGRDEQIATLGQRSGALTAQGALDKALSNQLGGYGGARSGVRVGISFVSKEGAYCRSFMLPAAAGLACRSGAQWQIPMLTNGPMGTISQYRQASSALPASVLEAIDARIAGAPLDASAEKAALRQGWER